MSPTEKKMWRAFFLVAACALLPFTAMFSAGSALLIMINMKVLRLIGVALTKFDVLK